MNKSLLLLLLVYSISSCKKEDPPINTDEVRIFKTINTINGNKVHLNFEYDAQERLTRLGLENTETKATVKYVGNEIIITEPTLTSPTLTIHHETRYVLDQNKNPTQRILTKTTRYFSPANDQTNFITDTTYYEYDASGLLTKTIDTHRDSTWILPGTASLVSRMALDKITILYTNSNGNLSSGNGTGTRLVRTFNGTSTIVFNSIIKKSIQLDYSSNYPNKTDFNNIFILNEYNIIFTKAFPESPFYILNKKYKNLPNRIDHNLTEEYTIGGTTQTAGGREEFTYAYNKYGFVTNIVHAGGANTNIDIVYNK